MKRGEVAHTLRQPTSLAKQPKPAFYALWGVRYTWCHLYQLENRYQTISAILFCISVLLALFCRLIWILMRFPPTVCVCDVKLELRDNKHRVWMQWIELLCNLFTLEVFISHHHTSNIHGGFTTPESVDIQLQGILGWHFQLLLYKLPAQWSVCIGADALAYICVMLFWQRNPSDKMVALVHPLNYTSHTCNV